MWVEPVRRYGLGEAHMPACLAAEDILIVKDDAHPDWMWHMEVSEVDGRYLILSVTQDTARVRAYMKTELRTFML